MDTERAPEIPEPTGDVRVDAVIQGLASLEDLDLAERPAVLETVHSRLRELLGEISPGEPGRSGEPPGKIGQR